MTQEQIELRDAWRTIYLILRETGYDFMYQDEITKVANVIRKEIELRRQNNVDLK